ncbi:MAG: hypothetical protein WD294_10425 [Phycisphaeraceae bacterium]
MNALPTQAGFEQVLLQPVERAATVALLRWSATLGHDQHVQIYVDGRLHDVVSSGAGEAWLHVDADDGAELRAELLAVPGDQAWTDFAHQLAGEAALPSRATVGLVRDASLPIDARVTVLVDGVAVQTQPMWGPLEARSGFGGLFGFDAFGISTATGVGLGLGEFGAGAVGSDGTAWRWEADDLPSGEHTLAVEVRDANGELLTSPSEQVVTIERLPRPAQAIGIDGSTLVWQ